MAQQMSKPKGHDTLVTLRTLDAIFTDWTEYSVTSDLLEPSDSFSFSRPLRPLEQGTVEGQSSTRLKKGMPVLLQVQSEQGSALQLNGRIYTIVPGSTRGGGSVQHVTGFDHMKSIVNASVPVGLQFENCTFLDVILRVLAPFGFTSADIITDNDVNRAFLTGVGTKSTTTIVGASAESKKEETIHNVYTGKACIKTVTIPAIVGRSVTVRSPVSIPIAKAKPHPTETVYAFLNRHAVRHNLLIWGTADGKIVFGRPDYNQPPSYSFFCDVQNDQTRTSVMSIARPNSIEGRPSEIRVYGKSIGGDFSRSDVHAVARDAEVEALGIYSPLNIHDNSILTNADADQRANYELSMRRRHGDMINVTLRGHADQNGKVYAIDTMAFVEWPQEDISDSFYVIRRTFSRTKKDGATTQLSLIPTNSIVLGAPSGVQE